MPCEPRLRTVRTNGIALRLAEAGPADGPPVMLLHGFPEPWFCWRRQIGPLAEAGYRVMAPSQRGYGESEKPQGARSYGLDMLTADIVGLFDALRCERVALVGHDWGGIVAWWVAIHHPERLSRLVILNAPHPIAFRRYLARAPGQLLRSWYVFAFQIPGLPEVMLRRRNWRALARTLVNTSRPGAFSEEELDRYRREWSRPGAITAMVNWYRAGFRHRPQRPANPRVHVATLVIWGKRDRFLSPGLVEPSLALCDRARLEWIDDATHWFQHEEPERVNRLVLDFLRERRNERNDSA